jgi:SAM-dependent methyltransferase
MGALLYHVLRFARAVLRKLGYGWFMDVVDLREFYAGALGQSARALIGRSLGPRLNPAAGQTVLGLGFAHPYFDDQLPENVVTLSFMLARQGVIHWPKEESVRSALVDECDLPLLESVADHVVVVHGLELSEDPQAMLHEIWRVMAPQGKLYLVVPNRRGLWSASDASPFGNGQPFSRSQLAGLLKEARFTAGWWKEALVLPPVVSPWLLKTASVCEMVGTRLVGRFSGVIIVEAMKQVYAFSSGKRTRRLMPRLRPALLPSPQHSNRMSPPSRDR